jgi:gliding motility-associated transport system permease protein
MTSAAEIAPPEFEVAGRSSPERGAGSSLRARATSASNIRAIVKRELISYFASPVAYVFIVIFLLLAGFFTFTVGGFFERAEASLVAFFMWHPWLYLFFVPAIGMRLWSEERRMGTIELLLTFPVAPWEAIVAKFLASWLVIGLALLLTFPVVLTVNWLGVPDNGVIASAYVGSLLMAGAYLATASMTSAMTRNQVVSFILSVVLSLFLLLVGWNPVTSLLARYASPAIVDFAAGFGFMTHWEGFMRGVVDLRDVVYFLSVMAFALFVTGVVLRNRRA